MGKFLKLITVDHMEGVSEHWCNNEGVAVLLFVCQYNQYWFLLINEKNPLLNGKEISHYGTLTGGCQTNKPIIETVKNEILEETGIEINNEDKVKIYSLGKHYANKTSIKIWHLYAIDISSLNLDLKTTYFGEGDGSDDEKGINGNFINENELDKVNDTLALAIYGKMCLYKIIIPHQQTV